MIDYDYDDDDGDEEPDLGEGSQGAQDKWMGTEENLLGPDQQSLVIV